MLQIDRCHLINLTRRPDRLELFQERFPARTWAACGLPMPERVEAPDGQKIPPPSWFTQQPGAWACLRAHLRLYEDALSRGENIFIWEDDCVFTPDFTQRLSVFLGAVPDDWDMVYLGGLHRSPALHPPLALEGNPHVFLGRAITTTYAYAVSARFLQVLYPLLLEAEQHHIDQMLARLMMQNTWRVYCPVPWLVGMDAGLSDICGRFYQRPHFWQYEPARASEPIYLEQLLSRVELRDGAWHDVPLTAPQMRPRLSSTIGGWFSSECGTAYRRECRAQAARRPGNTCHLAEVGCWRGRSLSFLADLISTGEVVAHAVDTWRGNSHPKDPTHQKDVFASFQENMSRLAIGDLLHVHRQASVEAAATFDDASLDVVMIDAGHQEHEVTADMQAWWPKLRPGGVLMGHDYSAACACPEVVLAVDRFVATWGLGSCFRAEADLWIIDKPDDKEDS